MERYESYKDSGVQWLGEIPGHWGCVKLKMFCQDNKEKNKGNIESCVLSLSYGNIIVKKNVNFGLVPENYDSYQIVNPGNIILRLTDLQNDHKSLRTGLVKNRGIITSAYVGLIVKNMNSEYTQLILHSYDVMKVFYGMGGGLRQSMSYTDIANVYIPVPPLSEQRSIVSFLDAKCGKIDEWIEKKQKEVELLGELKQRVIADAVTRGLNPHVKMKATNIPWLKEIPEHWEVLRNKSILRLTDEKVGNRNDLTLLSLTKQGVIIRDLSEGKGKFPKDFETYLVVRPNNLVFCLFDIDETPRTVGLVRNYGMLTGAYTNFEVNEDIVLPEYIYCYYLQIDDVKGLRPYYTGLRKVVKTNTFLQLRIPVPPLSEQQAIVSYINERIAKTDTLINNLNKEIEQLKEYKQRLISDVVTGQIKVC